MKNFLSKVFTKKNILPALIVLFSATFIISAGLLADYYIDSLQQKKQQQMLSDLVEQNTPTLSTVDDDYLNNYGEYEGEFYTQPITPAYTTIVHPKTGNELTLLTKYAALFELNQDVVGWIRINGTNINYPVMQKTEWVNYYLKRDFNGKDSKHGSIFVDERADIKLPSDNVTIYGHKMKDGSMFASLHNYKDISFFEKYPYIIFDTIYEYHTYKIISVFTIAATVDTDFPYHDFVDVVADSFAEFVTNCKDWSLYDTGEDAVYGDKLITLSTCDHSISDGRFVVVAKRIS